MTIGYKKTIKILLEEITPLALERIPAEYLALRESVVVVARMFGKKEIDIASDLKRAFYKQNEKGEESEKSN